MNVKTLRDKETKLVEQLQSARQAYEEAARAVVLGDSNGRASQAAARERIGGLEGEIADTRASIRALQTVEDDKRNNAEYVRRLRELHSASTVVARLRELAPQIVKRIEDLGAVYCEFVEAQVDARKHFRAANTSRNDFEEFDLA